MADSILGETLGGILGPEKEKKSGGEGGQSEEMQARGRGELTIKGP